MGKRHCVVSSRAMGLADLLVPGRPATYTEVHDVNVGPGFAFAWEDVTIQVGDVIHWQWVGGVHDVESGVGGNRNGNVTSGAPIDVIDIDDLPAVVSAFFGARVCPDACPG